ncbi:unnamed protein product [Rhodiola kirilowii]
MDTIRMIIALATQNRWKIHQMDVKVSILKRSSRRGGVC